MMKNKQLRQHLKFTKKHHKRLKKYKELLKSCGDNVFFEKNIDFLRFPKNASVADNVVIKEGARICPCNEIASISIGENTTIGYHTFIFSSSSITIGSNCLIAPFVYLVDSDHGIERGILINDQPNKTEEITIGNDVWIGAGAKILKGVKIADGAVIAAGAVVSENVGSNEIFGGIPAKKISERK